MATWQEYLEKLPKKYSEKDLKAIESAFNFASEIHKDERRLTGEPFMSHVAKVSIKTAEFNLDSQSVAAALLHDTYETNPSALKTIRKKFGNDIAFLVKSLSKVRKAKYHGAERSAESTRQMFMAIAQDIRVIIIKLFDRLDNLETLHVHPEQKQKRIANESLDIYAAVADRLGMGKIKAQIEDDAFKYAYPEEYNWITKETYEKIPEREKYLGEEVIPKIKAELQKEKVPVLNIKYRAKHYYSLWKKLLRNNMDWQMIYDLAAVRIVVNSLEDCYRTLGVIHKLWKPLPGRIKDYIALPKQNGYQSLHTTVFCIDNKVTEFQIRTKQMEQEAEAGIAAHWAWEMAGKPRKISKMPQQKFTWVKQLQEWQEKFHNNIKGEQFLESLKIDFFKDRVFVLTPKGDIIDLPEGATVVDFAYHVHSEIGDTIISSKVNHRIVPLSYQLASGDMVEILTQKNKKPSIRMLDLTKTSLAKSHIRNSLKKIGVITSAKTKKQNKADINITAEDRIGMAKDITSVFSIFRVNIETLSSKDNGSGFALVSIKFTPKNKEQIQKIATRLKEIKGVEEVEVRY